MPKTDEYMSLQAASITCTLQRVTEGSSGTAGIFRAASLKFHCVSFELPDRQNRPGISRIPAGTYRAIWSYSPKFSRDLYHLLHVPARDNILLHPFNFAGDTASGLYTETQGCIALGKREGSLVNRNGSMQHAIIATGRTVRKFEELAGGRPLIIDIYDPAMTD